MLLFCDSFDDRDINHIYDRYEAFSLSPITGNTRLTTGRTDQGLILSTNQVDGPFPDYIQKTFAEDHSTLIVGVACKFVGPTPIVSLRDDGTAQVYANLNADRTVSIIKFTDPETTLATSSQKLLFNKWYYIEIKATIDTIAGSYELRVDGVRWLSGSGVNTSATGTNVANQVRLVHTGGAGEYTDRVVDDLYIADDSTDSGKANVTDFAGPVHVKALFPDANGAVNDWMPSAGANFECVDEITGQNADTDYVGTTALVAGTREIYGVDNLPFNTGWGGTLVACMTHAFLRRTDVLSRSVNGLCRASATVYEHHAASDALGLSYSRLQRGWERDPSTSLAWTLAGVNAAQFGAETG